MAAADPSRPGLAVRAPNDSRRPAPWVGAVALGERPVEHVLRSVWGRPRAGGGRVVAAAQAGDQVDAFGFPVLISRRHHMTWIVCPGAGCRVPGTGRRGAVDDCRRTHVTSVRPCPSGIPPGRSSAVVLTAPHGRSRTRSPPWAQKDAEEGRPRPDSRTLAGQVSTAEAVSVTFARGSRTGRTRSARQMIPRRDGRGRGGGRGRPSRRPRRPDGRSGTGGPPPVLPG